jgi:3-deoxy-manno-octulosonate cytidylyltransferase (CMP-KDO synthetase)
LNIQDLAHFIVQCDKVELLEQLRILWHGEKIYVSVVNKPLPPGIDTEADLMRFKKMFENS